MADRLSGMSLWVLCLLLLSLLPVSIQAADGIRIFSVNADEWSRPRSGAVITRFKAIRAAVNAWEGMADAIILVRHPGEDSGEIWALELRDWLVSLGISNDYIKLLSGSQSADEIRLIVGKQSELLP